MICDAGPLIALAKLNRLELLAKVYDEVRVPSAVYREVVTQGLEHGAADARIMQLFWEQREWPITDVPEELLSSLQPSSILDAGEMEVLALASASPDALLLIDDELARREARRLGVDVKGTLGVLVTALRQEALTFQELEILIQQIVARPDIWIGARLCEGVLKGLEEQF